MTPAPERLGTRSLGVLGISRWGLNGGSARVARPLLPTKVHALLPLAIGGAWSMVIEHVQLRAMTDLGLVSVLPLGAILLLFLLAASFCLSLARRPLNPVVPLLHVIALVVMLYGVTTFLETVPRFAAVWKHMGIIDYVGRYHSINTNIDAFFNWPGFFALGALITKAAGFHSPVAIAGWGPLIFNLLFLAPLTLIFRWASDDPRVTWLGLWVFYSTNWVAQDYVSPQALGYTLWLSMLAALLTWFTPRPSALADLPALRRLGRVVDPRRLGVRLRPRRDELVVEGAGAKLGVLLLLIVAMYGAIVTGHQLTPVPAVLTVSGLVLFAQLEVRLLPVIMAVLLAAWISYMTTAYLAGHIGEVTGSIGRVSTNLNRSVSQHLGGSPGHELIVRIRELATLGIWLLGGAGLLRRLRAKRADVGIAVVAGVPFLLPALQPYGGEIALRVFLFSLPAVSFFIAALAFPSPVAGRTWLTTVVLALLGCVLLVVFQYTRYGNEQFDHFTKGDVATVQAFYRLAPRGTTVYAGDENLPWRYRDYAGYDYRAVPSFPEWNTPRPDPATLALRIRAALASSGGGYVIVTRSTKIAAADLDGKPHLLDKLVVALRALPGVSEIYRNQDGDLLYLPPAASYRRPGAHASRHGP